LLASKQDVEVVEGDVRSAADNRRAVATVLRAHGRLDVLVGNAGIWDFSKRLSDFETDRELEECFNELFDVNVKGYLLAAAAAREALVATRGTMIFTASSSSLYAGGGGPVYVASKHAVVGLIRQLAFELAPDVRVNGVAPGATETPLHGPRSIGLADTRVDEFLRDGSALARQIPLGFVALPHDHAEIYLLLAARDGARFTTGAVFPSDGGLVVRGGGRRHKKGGNS
jgi:NAD(P)-dependent dehydrogenase (short-subunit alcohol dehydrogenase family)